jgi:hypothetical protein
MTKYIFRIKNDDHTTNTFSKSLASVMIFSLLMGFLPPLEVRADNTLFVDISANPSTGVGSLTGVDLSAFVSGTAQGQITYRFDCTSDGNWDQTQISNNTSYTAVDLCNYPSPGNYTATVKVDRENLSFQGTLAILVENYAVPTVDLKINGSDGTISVPYNTAATLSWTSTNATSCTASGNWSGSKSLSGSESTGNLTASTNYTITCTGPGGTASDSVGATVQVPVPTVDLKINGSDGTISVPYNTAATLSWTSTNTTFCTASGNWSGSKSLSGSESTGNLTASATYTITCTGPGGTASDTVNVTVQSQPALYVALEALPNVGAIPLNGVSLRATVTGAATGSITFKFDCTSDGSWDHQITTDNIQYQATNLCSYANAGTFKPKVQVQRAGLTVEGTASVIAAASGGTPTLFVTLDAFPASGNSPLSSLLTATISGNVSGLATYRFDCTSDGTWDYIVSVDSASSTFTCNYSPAGVYVAKVKAERNNLSIWGNTTIVVR